MIVVSQNREIKIWRGGNHYSRGGNHLNITPACYAVVINELLLLVAIIIVDKYHAEVKIPVDKEKSDFAFNRPV